MQKLTEKLCRAFLVAAAALSLSGCPAVIATVGVAGGTALNDSRTIGAIAEDEAIETKLLYAISEKFGASVHVVITSYNRRVLLIGQVPSESVLEEVIDEVRRIENVRSLVNNIEIGNPSSLTARASDSVLTARVKTELCRRRHENFSCLDIKVVSEKGVVYLMGLVGKETAAIAIDTARRVPGVINVVKAFEYR